MIPHLSVAASFWEAVSGWQTLAALPVILGIAFLASRLLGVLRSFGMTIAAGLAGWLSGTGFSLVIAQNDLRAAGYTRNVWVFSAVFAMSASAWLELIARPGALARVQAGLSTFPRPIRALRRSRRRVGRYSQIIRIALKHGLGPTLGLGRGSEDAADDQTPVARRVRLALEEAGGIFVKVGQVLSTRPDLLPAAAVHELELLQDHAAPADRHAVEALLCEELGVAVSEVFAEFDWQPIAAASIGQAYRGRLLTGQAVIVKVQRPDIRDLAERDIDVILELAGTAESRAPWASEYRVRELASEFTERLREELDFRVEARNASELAKNLGGFPDVHIPAVYLELSTSRVLVMEELDGVNLRQTGVIDDLGHDRRKLADVLLRCAMQQMLIDGFFHADPHPGNVMVLTDGRIGLLDFGAAARLDPAEQAALRQMLLALHEKDAAMLRRALLDVATPRRGLDDDKLERTLARFMSRHLAPGAALGAAMLNDLIRLVFTFGIALPAEFTTFMRAMITLEGTLTTLSPGYPVLDEAQALAGEWAREQLEPSTLAEFARSEVMTLAPILRRLPQRADRLAGLLERGDLTTRVSLFATEEDAQVVTRLFNRGVLAGLGSVVGVMSVMLLGTDGGPAFTGDTSLFEFFGYFGLFCSTVLILRVIVAIMRDGLN